jgi:polar amino acid transport system substrate-binding protein
MFMQRTLVCVAFCIAALALAACGGSSAPTASPQPAHTPVPTFTPTPVPVDTATPESTSTPAPAPTIPVITVGVNPAFRPYIFVEDGKGAGFDVELLNAMAAAKDFEVAYVITPFDEIFRGLEGGRFDAAISAITITDERQQQVDFTAPYFTTGQAALSFYSPGQGLAVRADNTTLTGTASLTAEVTVGVKSGTTGARFVAENTSAQAAIFPEADPALQALADGQVDAVVVDIPVIAEYIKTHPDAGLKLAGGPVTEEAYGIAVSKARPELLKLLNEALAQVQADGTYDRIFQKWFAAP